MPTTLRDLLSDPSLGLIGVGATAHPDLVVQRVATTEVLDPTRFLSGGELLLTTGVRQRTVAQQRQFVDAAARARVGALGFGTGLGHQRVPAALVQRADDVGLPLLEVPLETPFIAVSQIVADQQVQDHVQRLQQVLQTHQQLAEALLSGGGVGPFVYLLARLVHGRAALERYGTVLHRAVSEDLEDRHSADAALDLDAQGPLAPPEGGQRLTVPVATGQPDRCRLHLWTPVAGPADGAEAAGTSAEPLQRLAATAQHLLAVHLSSDARAVQASRQLAGEVLKDVVAGGMEGEQAAVRLASLGVDITQRMIVVVIEATNQVSARLLTSLPLPARYGHGVAAVVEQRLVAVVPVPDSAGARAAGGAEQGAAETPALDGQVLMEHLERAGVRARAGAGAAYPRPEGLRWSYYEALEALHSGTGFTQSRRLTMASLLLAAQEVPLKDLAAQTLDPLHASDQEHGTELALTLQTYLEADGQSGEVARHLGIHRNTVRYRLQQIAQLTGYDPAVTAGRVHLWLALAQERQSRR